MPFTPGPDYQSSVDWTPDMSSYRQHTDPEDMVGRHDLKVPCSVIVLTRNEETNIASCLQHLAASDDVVVLDSVSTDRTREIAAQFENVRVFERPFDTEYQQRSFAIHQIAYRHKWLYICDADEWVPEALWREIAKVINNPTSDHVAYRVGYKNHFLGQWLQYGGIGDVLLMRLVQPDKVSYEDRATNIHLEANGTVGQLHERFRHYSYRKGLVSWFHKHNVYASLEAVEASQVRHGSIKDALRMLGAKDAATRRRGLKNLSFFLPARYFIRFFYTYFLKLGFLDGRAGLHYAFLMAMYEYWISAYLDEICTQPSHRTRALAEALLHPPQPLPLDQPRVTVMIPTLNEADNIEQCIEHAKIVGPVMVLDSLSTDGTQELATRAGAVVVEHRFEGYAEQKNWGLRNLPIETPWVLILDADERLTQQSASEILNFVQNAPSETAGMFINRMILFWGRAVRHGGYYPSWNLRLFRRGKAFYESRRVHEHMLCQGHVGYLRKELMHIRDESLQTFIAKHIRYADLESDEWLDYRHGTSKASSPVDLFSRSLRFRQFLKRRIWPRLPMRPLIRFVYMHFFKLGFMDGKAGWHLTMLLTSYEYMTGLLIREKFLWKDASADEPVS